MHPPTNLRRDCTIAGVFLGLSLSVGALILLELVLFVALMTLVLASYRKLPYGPWRFMNTAARLQLRTRGFSALFFVISISLIFFVNPDSCNANLEMWLGLGPVHVSAVGCAGTNKRMQAHGQLCSFA